MTTNEETLKTITEERDILKALLSEPRDLHTVFLPSMTLVVREDNGRVYITKRIDNKKWADITGILEKLTRGNR